MIVIRSSPKKEKPQNISNVFASGDDDAQQQANKNKAKAQESSQVSKGVYTCFAISCLHALTERSNE